MRALLCLMALALVVKGLWDHDWKLILAGAVTAVAWPIIAADVREVNRRREHKRLLDHLWDDDDLSRSA